MLDTIVKFFNLNKWKHFCPASTRFLAGPNPERKDRGKKMYKAIQMPCYQVTGCMRGLNMFRISHLHVAKSQSVVSHVKRLHKFQSLNGVTRLENIHFPLFLTFSLYWYNIAAMTKVIFLPWHFNLFVVQLKTIQCITNIKY